ncbi:MAG: molybdenum cofactor guanylyltransferase [Acidobacteriota bacterium]|nr:molybdenum cofactor guanylyltransferase [Acidobacteriota bacterium]
MSTAAILAGGQARRFNGYQKPLLPLGRQRIVDHLLDVLGTVVDNVFVVANDQEQYETCNVPVIQDIKADLGPIGGMYTALSHCESNQVLIVAGDMPFLSCEFLRYLLKQGQLANIAIPRTADGYQPLCASYHHTCADVVATHIKKRSLKLTDLLSDIPHHEVSEDKMIEFDRNGSMFFNINTPADYARALSLAAYHAL